MLTRNDIDNDSDKSNNDDKHDNFVFYSDSEWKILREKEKRKTLFHCFVFLIKT